jgi:periplasmic protein TonB
LNDQIRSPWAISIAAHAIALLALGATIASNYRREMETIPFQLIAQTKTPLAVSDGRSVPAVDQQRKVKRVSGISRKAVQSETNPLETKQGNTLAKAADSEVLEKDDPNALPATVDEFLVNQMPKLLSEVRVEYPEQAKKKGVQGVVVLDLLIDDTGRVRDVALIDGPGFGMNEAAISAVRGFRFHPATSQEGKPVAVRIRYGYRFVLER